MKRLRSMLATAAAACTLAALALPAPAAKPEDEDVVHRRNGIIDRGKILSYDATGVRLLRGDTRREMLIPIDQVERVEVNLTDAHEQANTLFEQKQYAAAAERFEAALKIESRDWLRARIATGLVACYVAAGDPLAAIDAFFAAAQATGGHVSLAAVPLCWSPEPQATHVVERARTLLNSDNPMEQVIAASYLFGTPHANSARQVLGKLSTYRDERVSQLARTQVWRWDAATATADEVATWERQVAKLPADARGGPYFAVGLALQRLSLHEEAALAFFWPAWVYRDDPTLARRAALLAAESLELAGQTAEARQLYQEVVARYRPSKESTAAQRRLDILKE